jgi:hypothetical protein
MTDQLHGCADPRFDPARQFGLVVGKRAAGARVVKPIRAFAAANQRQLKRAHLPRAHPQAVHDHDRWAPIHLKKLTRTACK